MDIDHLRTFVEAIRHGSFSAAADSLNMSQPGISRRIHRLEKEMGVALLDRTGGRFTPTREGLRFLRFAEHVLREYDTLVASLRDPTPISGTVQVAASTTPGEYLLPDLLSRFVRRYPDVRTSLAVMDSETVESCVGERHCDVGFLGRPPRSRLLAGSVFAHDEILLAVPRSHPLADAKEIAVERLEGERFISRQPGSGTQESVESALQAAGLRLPKHAVLMELSSARSQLSAICAGHGIGFVSRLAIEASMRTKIALLRIQRVRLTRTLYMIYEPNRNDPHVVEFIRYMQEVAHSSAETTDAH